jgi:hypothetical protein
LVVIEGDDNNNFIEGHVNKMIQGVMTFLNPHYGNTTPEEEAAAVIKINPAIKKYSELKIKILQDSPRDADKLKDNLQAKQREYRKAQDKHRTAKT